MTRNELLARLTRGLNADLVDYGELRKLLKKQFDAALHHRSEELSGIVIAVTDLAETIEERRSERVELVSALLNGDRDASVSKVFALLPEAPREMLKTWWRELENLVRECKELNARIGRLVMDQHEIMKRILDREVDIYVPT